ncbi:hypothetical protein O3M35_003919 [Rhynocoris fuscipes]|uniref:SANT and BTB domain-containing protein n=1 Tax=Rhynocoris fuscipes TaxID=488301 RepID=A0AAW1CHS8_9HEMI
MAECEKVATTHSGDRPLVSLREFFDFLYIAYRVNQELNDKENLREEISVKKRIGWDELRENELVCRLISVANSDLQKLSLSKKDKISRQGDGKASTCEEFCNCQDCLQEFYESEEGVWSFSSTEENKTNEQSVRSLRVKINRKNHHWKRRNNSKTLSTNKIPLIKWVSDVLTSMASEIVDEGVLDSVLPFIIPNSSQVIKLNQNDHYKRHINDKESLTISREFIQDINKENEIDIQVCDEVKKTTKVFKCAQGVLLKKMKYFAGVTAGQRLEDMDISVHCDLSVFEWLMKWVKSTDKNSLPKLTINNVIPILVSAAFLLMEPLITECLTFLKFSLDEVIENTATLSCLNDRTLGRLSELMTNIEVESIKDRKDKILSRLYCKMILNLAKKSPEPSRGHYSSITKLYHCSACNQLLHSDYGSFIKCVYDNIKIDNNGQMQSDHQLDPEWNLNEYIKGLKMELKSWRKVYWWLWGLCHYLYCCYCSRYYPGCQYRSHSPKMDALSENILSILRKQENLICVPAPTIGALYDEIIRITKVREGYKATVQLLPNYTQNRFFNIEILSKRTTENLLGINCKDESCTDCSNSDKNDGQDIESPKNKLQNLYDEFVQEYSSINMDSSSQSDEDDMTDESIRNKATMTKTSSADCSKVCWPRKEVYAERWIPKLPVRFNQDNLRDREERLVENLIRTLTRKGNELNHIPIKFHANVQHIARHSFSNFKNTT